MGFGSILGGLISVLGSGLSGFFGTKLKQGELVGQAIDAVGKVIESKAQSEHAAALVVVAEAQSDSWIAKNWRPMTMVFFVILIGCRFFGITPSNMSLMEYDRLWDLVEIGMGGYIASRTVEKIVSQIGLGSVLKKYLEQLTLNKGK